MYKLFYLSHLPPTVDKYYDNDKYISKINNNLHIILSFNRFSPDSLVMGRFPVLVMSNSAKYHVHVGLSTGVSNTTVKF